MQKNTFAIITTTYNRPDLLERALASVYAQTIQDWILIIINDSPDYDYSLWEQKNLHKDSQLVYIKNETNKGKNYSVNKAFEHLNKNNFQGYIVFLDDDDWLHPQCLESFNKEIIKQGSRWIVSKRSTPEGKDFTQNNTRRSAIHYLKDSLILKRFTGDTTQCIHFPTTRLCSFSHEVKNGEEWLYYSQIASIIPKFLFINSTGTYSAGYELLGLTKKNLSFFERYRLYFKLHKELTYRTMWNVYILTYMILRFIKLTYKS